MKPREWNISGPAKIETNGGGGGAVSPSADVEMIGRFDPITALASYIGMLRSRQPGHGNPLAHGSFDPLAEDQAAPLEQVLTKLVGNSGSPFPSHHPSGGGGSHHSSSSGNIGNPNTSFEEIDRQRKQQEAADRQLAFQRQNERQQAALGLDLGRQQLGDARSKTNLRNNVLNPQMIGQILQKIMSRY